MGRKVINGKDVVITPRNGRNWCDLINKEPLPKRVDHSLKYKINKDGSWLKNS